MADNNNAPPLLNNNTIRPPPPPPLPPQSIRPTNDLEGDTNQILAEQVQNSLDEFSSPEKTGSTDEGFLQSNSLIANFAFIVLVLVAFLVLLNLGIYTLYYLLEPTKNPYIINGTIQGNNYMTVSRNPKAASYVVLQHSNNEKGGIEFTWSVWLTFNHIDNLMKTTYAHIFSVGTNDFDSHTGVSMGNNGPGLYLRNEDPSGNLVNTANVLLVMDTMSASKDSAVLNTDTTPFSTEIQNLPYNKWFHLALRMHYNSMDIYVNGTVTNRINFDNVPRQNYEDVLLCANGGFSGQMSNLRYYNHALNIFEIKNLVYWGPSLKAATNTTVTANGNYNYLSNWWYMNKL
jgi:hypothetical protein